MIEGRPLPAGMKWSLNEQGRCWFSKGFKDGKGFHVFLTAAVGEEHFMYGVAFERDITAEALEEVIDKAVVELEERLSKYRAGNPELRW